MADMNDARYYPFGGSFAHVVGYVAKVSDRDVKAIRDRGEEVPPLLFNPSFSIGRQGVEKALDEALRGEPGGNRVEIYSGSYLVLAPDWQPVTWNEQERGTGTYWGGALPESFIQYATPNAAAKKLASPDYQNNKAIFPDAETLSRCEVPAYLGEDGQKLFEEAWTRIQAA